MKGIGRVVLGFQEKLLPVRGTGKGVTKGGKSASQEGGDYDNSGLPG